MTELNVIDGSSDQTIATTTASVRIRAPKRILHFSDGTLEEYSDDDVDGSDKIISNDKENNQVDVVSIEFYYKQLLFMIFKWHWTVNHTTKRLRLARAFYFMC